MNVRLYFTAIGDLALIAFSFMADIDPILRSLGLVVGLAVGVFTLVKLYHDIKLKSLDLELKRKELKNDKG